MLPERSAARLPRTEQVKRTQPNTFGASAPQGRVKRQGVCAMGSRALPDLCGAPEVRHPFPRRCAREKGVAFRALLAPGGARDPTAPAAVPPASRKNRGGHALLVVSVHKCDSFPNM